MPGSVIWLNKNNAHLKELKATDNQAALLDICLAMFCFTAIESDQHDKFPWAREHNTFLKSWSHVMTEITNCKEGSDGGGV